MISGFDCANCKAPAEQHADGSCLFSPTKYRMMTAVELYEARRKLLHTWTTYESRGIGIANTRAVQRIKFGVTVNGVDQYGNPVTEEL